MTATEIALLLTAIVGVVTGIGGFIRAVRADRRASVQQTDEMKVNEFEAISTAYAGLLAGLRLDLEALRIKCEDREKLLLGRIEELERLVTNG